MPQGMIYVKNEIERKWKCDFNVCYIMCYNTHLSSLGSHQDDGPDILKS